MNTNQRPPTAKICQFPLKDLRVPGRPGRVAASVTELRPQTFPAVEFGSGWYHDAAIQAELPRKS